MDRDLSAGPSRLVVPAPAKLNLFLHVTGRRPDGYHLLESLMVLVDLADRLSLTVRDDGRVMRERPVDGVDESDDLTIRAALRLKARTGTPLGVSIGLEKNVPIGAGLGGGSSDAATVLLGLNRLWNLGLSRRELMDEGVKLGADVPFFVFGANAHATGIGEVLREVTVPRVDVLIAAPDAGVATASIFGAAHLNRSTPSSGAEAFTGAFGHNDLQPVAVEREPAIGSALAFLDSLVDDGRHGNHGTHGDDGTHGDPPAVAAVSPSGWIRTGPGTAGSGARMSGSGSAAFRVVSAATAAAQPPMRRVTRGDHGFRVFRARVLASHPLREFAAK